MLCQLGGKMKHTVESLKECMKVTEEEEKYRNEDFNVSELNYQNTKFTCTRCSKNLRSQIEGKQSLIVHPLLDVLLCKSCCDFYGDGDFSLDDEGEDKYCRWCGRGGTLFTCSKCICAFCNRCIKKHFGVNILKKITEDDNWVCYFCNPKPLWYLRSICWLAKKINAKVVEKSNNVSSKEHILDTSDSVDSDESTNTRQRFRLKRSLRSSKQITYSKCRLSSSEEEKENKVNERSRRNKIKAQIFETDEDESPGTARKRKKVSNDVEEGSEETKQIVNRNLVIEKFKEIWKMLLITTEVGLKWSKNRLEILSNPDRGKIIDDLGKEYKHLQSVAAMLSSSISKATDSIEALKDDLTCKNATSLKEMDVIESSLWFEMIERFVRSKDYNPLLGLKILANAMYTRLVEPELKKEKNCVTPTENLPVQGGDSGSDTTINSEKVETVSQKSYKSADQEISCSEKRQQNGIGDIQIAGEQTGTNSFDLSNNKEQPVTPNTSECNLFKKQFFSSDSDDSSIDMNLTETKLDRKLESEERQIPENSKQRKEPNNERKERDEDDEIGKLQSLLRQVQVSMTEGSSSNKSNGGIKKPAKQKMKKSNTAEESLLDFMNDKNKQLDNCLELEVVQEMSKEKDENFNALIKSTFLLSSDENAASSDDEDPEKPRPKMKLTVNSKGKAKSVDSHDERIVRKRNSLTNFNFFLERGAKSVSDFDDDSESFIDSDDFSNSDNKKSRVDRKKKNKVSESGEVLHNFSSYDSSDSDIQHVSTVKRHENENLNDSSIAVENKNTETKKEEILTEKKISSNPPQSDLDPVVTEELIVVEDNHHSPVKKNLESPGRRNINKILTKSSLELSTKQARKMEKERNKRLAAKQNMLAEISSCQLDSSSRLILDFDPVTMKELVVVDKNLTSRLKPHQKAGVKFMWDACFESLQRLKEDSGSGCILAHCMGLGKTLQVITLVHTLFSHDTGVKSAMILCPLNTVRNWLKEFRTWLQKCHVSVAPFEIISCKTNAEKLKKISQWKRRGGVFVVSYEMFRSMMNMNKSEYGAFYPALCDPGPDLVICDEGHLLKNTKTALSKCVSRIRTLRRIVLTGTPLQNNLIEYYCMIHFVKPNILGTMKEFLNGFVNPIKNGQFEDSTTNDVILMKKRAHVLHSLLGGFVQRFGYNVLTPFLPEKYEYVISICLTPTQDRLYRMFINKCTKVEGLLQDFHWLQKVWTHPKIMINAAEQQNESDKINDMRRKEHWLHMVEPNEYNNLRSSGKLVILFKILKSCRKIGDKILIFSQYLSTLNLIEHFLRKANDEYGKCPQNEFVDTWVFGEDYFRIDGSTNSSTRYDYCKKFNDVNNQRSRVLLISTKAGGMGINLIGANRVVIFDVSWNPSHDVQSIFRVYRFGQVKPCYIYRFIAEATMEEKIYKRQVNKLSLAHRIVDEHQIERHYSMMNLQELYNYDPAPKDKWRIPIVPKDCLFAELLASSRDIVVNYHEHDTLLENKEEEELTEEERRAAWEDFEKERFQSQTIENDNLVHLYDMPHNSTLSLIEEHNDMISNDSQNKMCRIVEVRTLINHQAVQAGEDDIRLVKNLPLIEE